jgi:signal transduction histidine kinase
MIQSDPFSAANGSANTVGAAGDDVMASAAPVTAVSREEVLEEVRQLVTDLRDAAQDGRGLAKRYAEVLQNVVDEYCLEFEQRAQAALEKLENFK